MICYKITNIVTGKKYIGLTIRSVEKRWKEHCNSALGGRTNFALAKDIRQYGVDAFIVEEMACAIDGTESLKDLEQTLIKQEDCLSPSGYNLTIGGQYTKYSEETRKKMSITRKGKKQTPEHIENARLARIGLPSKTKGRKRPSSEIEKIKTALIGYTWINNGVKRTRLKQGDILPEGWAKGYKL